MLEETGWLGARGMMFYVVNVVMQIWIYGFDVLFFLLLPDPLVYSGHFPGIYVWSSVGQATQNNTGMTV